MGRIVERHWRCDECGEVILGRHKNCPNDGAPREKGEMLTMDELELWNADGTNAASTVTDPKLLELARAGADWFCTHCSSGNRGDTDTCSNCAAPRYAKPEEDHPSFAGDHQDVKGWDDRLEEELDGGWASEQPTHIAESTPPDSRNPFYDKMQEDVDDKFAGEDWEPPVKTGLAVLGAGSSLTMLGIGAAVVLLVGFLFWAFQTHESEGTVDQMTWEQSTIRHHWTQLTVRKWRDSTSTRTEIKPRNGSGERAGMTRAGGCREEHHHDEEYQCGTKQESYDCSTTESYSATCSKSESYACGETCRDNGNGFSTCSTKYCSRSVDYSCTKSRRVPKTCERTVPKYCSRPIYETKCNYETQEWRTVETKPATGSGLDTRWPEITPGPEDRLRYAADYSVTIGYEDDKSYTLKPGDTSTLGMQVTLTRAQALAAESAFQSWEPGETVTLTINNLGGVHSVEHGGIEIAAVEQ